MYKLIEFFKYIFLVCYWKVTDLWKKAWGKKSSNMPDYMNEQRTDPTLLNIKDTHSLFASPTRDATVFMSEPIFEKIVHSLPTSYTFPDLSTLSNIEKCYAKTTAVEKDAERNGEPSVSKIKAELPNDDTTLTPSAVMKPNRSKHLNQRIHFAKTTTANIAFEPKASSLSSDENKTAAVPKTEPALIITPLQSSKKIIEPVDQNSKSSKTGHYKFVFIK